MPVRMNTNVTKKISSQSGFTLVELIIVISITTLVMAISVPSFLSYSRRQQLNNQAENLVSQLEFAQSKARTGDQGSDETDDVQGYFLEFENTDPGNGVYKYYLRKHRNDTSVPIDYNPIVEEYSLSETITSVSVLADGAASNNEIFYYKSPTASFVCLDDFPADGTEQTTCSTNVIQLILYNDQGETHYVYIEKGGVIYENES